MAHSVSVKGPFLLGVSASIVLAYESNLSKPIVGKGASFAQLFQVCTSNRPCSGAWHMETGQDLVG